MPDWLQLNWAEMFVPSMPILEIIIRGTCMYLALFFLLRTFRRQTGSIGRADLLVLLLIADAAQNGMANQYKSITDGLLLVATIIFWEYALDWLSYHLPVFGRLIERSPLLLIEHGKIQARNLAKELITEDELLSQLRQRGVSEVALVQHSFVEGDGHISVITNGGVSLNSTAGRDNSGVA